MFSLDSPIGFDGRINTARQIWHPRQDKASLLWLETPDTSYLSTTGSNVNSITDQIGGVVFTASATKPTLVTTLNGRSGIKFSSTGPSYLSNGSVSTLNGKSACTVFLVFRHPTAAADYAWHLTNQASIRFSWFNGNDPALCIDAGPTSTGQPTGGSTIYAGGVTTLVSYTVDKTLSTSECVAYMNGANVGQSRSVDGNSSGAFSSAGMWFGTQDGTQRSWNNGELGAFGIADGVLSAPKRRMYEVYLAQRFGITLL